MKENRGLLRKGNVNVVKFSVNVLCESNILKKSVVSVRHAPTVKPTFSEPSTVSLGNSAFDSRSCIKAFLSSNALVRIDAAGLCWLQRLLIHAFKASADGHHATSVCCFLSSLNRHTSVVLSMGTTGRLHSPQPLHASCTSLLIMQL
jgi:hypothetical protein